MKKFKWLTILIVSICFVMGSVSMGWSADVQKTTGGVITTTQPKPIFLCPAGWEKDTSTTNPYICKPKPVTFSCPQGYIFVDHIKCKMEPVSGTLSQGCQGCWVGCVKQVEPPK